jgi:ABC-type multidrug transport system ATPase subunit
MNDKGLKKTIRLLSFLQSFDINSEKQLPYGLITSYIKSIVKYNEQAYIDIYNFHLKQIKPKSSKKYHSKISVKLLAICYELNVELSVNEKIKLLILLFKLYKLQENKSHNQIDVINTIVLSLGFDIKEIENYALFVDNAIDDKDNIFEISANPLLKDKLNSRFSENLSGKIILFYFDTLKVFVFKYIGKDTLFLDGEAIIENEIYVFYSGATIYGAKIQNINYSDISFQINHNTEFEPIKLNVDNVFFRYKNSDQGVGNITIDSHGGNLIGILGASGTGKTTLLKLISGLLEPQTGQVLINNENVYKNEVINKIIGFVPQDDYFIENLTVNENIKFYSELSSTGLSKARRQVKINNLLEEIGVFSIKNRLIGSALNRNISGGQRKRMNVALELLRDPQILILDEPTSGLSYTESLNITRLLKEQTYHGRLVITTLHQPSSEIFTMLDQILILDKGGVPIYFGNPASAISYFKTNRQLINPLSTKCPTCGYVDAGQIFELIEETKINAQNEIERVIKPEEWHRIYKEKLLFSVKKTIEKDETSDHFHNHIKTASRWSQFKTYLKRNIYSKFRNFQYLALIITEAPLLALILSYFSKYIAGSLENPSDYIFYLNDNIPAYIFMSVIVALFLGLTLSAEEIIGDKIQLMREKFLGLSRFAYINSKVVYLISISAIQTLMFTLIGNGILEIQGAFLYFWLILFSVFCFGNLLGLILSTSLKSAIAIYILIPLMVIPQILLGGMIIEYHKINKGTKAHIATPFIADIMVTRWAFEALSVNQFKNNALSKSFYGLDREISESKHLIVFLIPELENTLDDLKLAYENKDQRAIIQLSRLFQNTINTFNETDAKIFFNIKNRELILVDDIKEARKNLRTIKNKYQQNYNQLLNNRDSEIKNIGSDYKIMKDKSTNKKLKSFLSENFNEDVITEVNNTLIRTNSPIYTKPVKKNGRAHYLAPEKIILKYPINTFIFNLVVIWLMNLILYIALLQNAIIRIGERLNLFYKSKK